MSDVSLPVTSGARVRINNPDWAAIVAMCDLNDEDLAILAANDLSADGDAVAENFYGRVLQEPNLKRIIESNSNIDRLTATLKRYWSSMFSGRYDDETVKGREHIGVVHDRIELPLGAYLGAYLKIDEVVFARLVEAHRDDPETLFKALVAYRRAAQTDMSIVVQSFLNRREEKKDEMATRVSSLSETLAAAAEEAHASTETMLGTTESMVGQAEESTAALDTSVGAAKAGSDAMDSTAEAVAATRAAVDQVREQLGVVVSQTNEIESIVSSIERIADQTNLLSLNAAIEAARAGEHGRGFAVVAEEVRKLATDTRKSLGAISQLNEGSSKAIKAVEEALAQTDDSVEAVQGQTDQLRQSLDEVRESSEAVAERISVLRVGVDSIAASARDLNEASREVAQGADTLATLSTGGDAHDSGAVASVPRTTNGNGNGNGNGHGDPREAVNAAFGA